MTRLFARQARSENGTATGSSLTDLKAAMEALGAARAQYQRALKDARSRLKAGLGTQERDIAQARKALDDARGPRKLGSLGVAKRVTLTEDSISTPNGRFALTEGIGAHAEQHGTKQVVQGSVVKSNQDRREVFLHINGPDWADVISYARVAATRAGEFS